MNCIVYVNISFYLYMHACDGKSGYRRVITVRYIVDFWHLKNARDGIFLNFFTFLDCNLIHFLVY